MYNKQYLENLTAVHLLIELSNREGCVSTAKSVFINKVAEKLEVNTDDLLKIKSGELMMSLPKFEFQTIPYFHRLLLLLSIEERGASAKELSFILDIGVRLGLHPQALQEIVQRLKDKPNTFISPLEMNGFFKRYYN